MLRIRRFRPNSSALAARFAWSLGLALLTGAGCGPERPPAPEDSKPSRLADPEHAPQSAGDPGLLSGADLESGALLTYAGPKGAFFDVESLDEVPPESRGFVRVILAQGAKPPAGQVWVVNFDAPAEGAEDSWPLKSVPRELFEEFALGQGNSSQVDTAKLPEGLEPPEAKPAPEKLVVYKTEWCGVCKKLRSYLDRKGVEYELKDVEKDPGAAAELQAFAADKGGWRGSVPVIRIGDEMMTGFDRARLEKML